MAPDHGAPVPAEGLRQRKRRQTRDRITKSAMALFREHGFEATTLDDIAAAAGISKRSFFAYFPSKEAVVFAWQDGFGEDLFAAVAAWPPGEPSMVAAERALSACIGQIDLEEAAGIGRLIHDTPVLRARDHAKYENLERGLTAALSARLPRSPEPPDALCARLVAMIVIGTLRVAGEIWFASAAKGPLEDYAQRILKDIRAGLRGLYAP